MEEEGWRGEGILRGEAEGSAVSESHKDFPDGGVEGEG